jgi:limonene 1,2-monooxygenase
MREHFVGRVGDAVVKAISEHTDELKLEAEKT